MTAETDNDGEPTLLRALLRARHWQKHSTFAGEWDKVARSIDAKLVGSWPRHAQFYRWLRGELRELPYPDACRMLEAMFPEHDVNALFRPCPPDIATTLAGPRAARRSLVGTASNEVCAHAGLPAAWPRTNPDVPDDLVSRVESAREQVSIFGLTRNFCAEDELLPLFEARAAEIPVTFYLMEPRCESRRDRYRLEPIEAAMEDPARYTREILRPLFLASQRVASVAAPSAGMHIFTYNFPCSFAIEKIDRSFRILLYGHGKRGRESPILVFDEGTPYWDYFDSQMRWLQRIPVSRGQARGWLYGRYRSPTLLLGDETVTTIIDREGHRLLMVANRAAALASAVVRSHTASTLTAKGERDFASDVDLMVEKLIFAQACAGGRLPRRRRGREQSRRGSQLDFGPHRRDRELRARPTTVRGLAEPLV